MERTHYPAILAFVHRSRFAIANQIRRRFPEFLPSERTARRHLEEMESLGLLGVAPARGVSPLFPKVYYATGKGVRRLRESLRVKGKQWHGVRVDRRGRHSLEGFSAEHIIHELLITEFLLGAWQTARGRPDLELLTVQRRSLAKHPAFSVSVRGRTGQLVPDAMFLIRQEASGMICSFLELDLGTMNTKQLRMKFARYAAWAQSAIGEKYLLELYRCFGANEPKATFRLLFVARSRSGANDEGRLIESLSVAARVAPEIQSRIWLTTAAALSRRQAEALPLGGDVWLRGRECSLQMARNQLLTSCPRHSLFPQPPSGVRPMVFQNNGTLPLASSR